MSPRADHAATIIAAADVRRRVSSQDHHPAAGRARPTTASASGETDVDPEPGTTADHSGDPSGSIPPAPYRLIGISFRLVRSRRRVAQNNQYGPPVGTSTDGGVPGSAT